jgi:prepilin-type N-terminal cleavage/methylation domain-containing protein
MLISTNHSKALGFTLIEMMLSIAIISLLAGLSFTGIFVLLTIAMT